MFDKVVPFFLEISECGTDKWATWGFNLTVHFI